MNDTLLWADNDIENEGDNKTDITITIHLSNKK